MKRIYEVLEEAAEKLAKVKEIQLLKQNKEIQYFHQQENTRFTAAVEVDFTREDLAKLFVSHDFTLQLNVGIAKVHKKDKYNKAIGREVALEAMKIIDVVLCNVEIDQETERAVYTFRSNWGSGGAFVFRTSDKSSKPHLISMSL